MLPDFAGGLLPEGVHVAEWKEIVVRFGGNDRRDRLLTGLGQGARALQAARCGTLWLDGSFVTAKEFPRDFDACWDTADVDLGLLDPVLLDFSNDRLNQKTKYGGEFFPNFAEAVSGLQFKDFFQRDKETGRAKGLVELDLRGFTP